MALSRSVIAACHDAIIETVRFAELDRVSLGDDAEPRSTAWQEFYMLGPAEAGPDHPWTANDIRAAYSVGSIALMTATQTLFSLSHLIRVDQQIAAYGFEVMSRSVIEASARAWWLYEPEIGVRARVARAKAVELFSVDEGLKFQKKLKEPPVDHFGPVREVVLRDAETLGLTPYLNKNEELVGFEGQRRPNSTPIIEDLLVAVLGDRDAARVVYPLYSAIDHATIYAMTRTLFTLGKTKTMATVSPEVTNEQVVNAAAIAVHGYLGAYARRASIYGFDWRAIEAKRMTLVGPIYQAYEAAKGSTAGST